MSVLICNACGERYGVGLIVDGEPCPKASCNGTVYAFSSSVNEAGYQTESFLRGGANAARELERRGLIP